MKIALCFAGQPRSAEKTVEYYRRNLLDHYDVDIFFHTWVTVNADSESTLDFQEPYYKYVIDRKFDLPFADNICSFLNNKYTHTPNPAKWPPAFTVQSFYSINEVSKQVINHETFRMNRPYDWVIKTRFDYALNKRIEFEFLDNSKLYVPDCRMTPQRNFCNDQFAFGNSLTMRKYMSTFQFMDLYYHAGVSMIGEDMLAANLAYHKLTGDNMVYTSMNNPFPPGPHNGTWHSLVRDDYEKWVKQ